MSHRKEILKKFIIDSASKANLEIAHDIWKGFPALAVEHLLAPFFEDVRQAVLTFAKSGASKGRKWASSNYWNDLTGLPNDHVYLTFYLDSWNCGHDDEGEWYSITIECNRKLKGLFCGIGYDDEVETWSDADLRIAQTVNKLSSGEKKPTNWYTCWRPFPEPYQNLLSFDFLKRLVEPASTARKQSIDFFVDYLKPYFHEDALEATNVAAKKRKKLNDSDAE